MALGSYGAVTVTSAATLIITSNPERKGVLIFNNTAATLFIGPDANITTANAIPVLQNTTFNDSGTFDAFRGSIYGIVAAASNDVRFWEFIQ